MKKLYLVVGYLTLTSTLGVQITLVEADNIEDAERQVSAQAGWHGKHLKFNEIKMNTPFTLGKLIELSEDFRRNTELFELQGGC